MAKDDLYTAAATLLAAAEASLTTAGISLPPARWVHLGDVAWDCCGQLVSRVVRVRDSDAVGRSLEDRVPRKASVLMVDFEVNLVLCVPAMMGDGTMPTPGQMNTAAKGAYAAAWSIWNGLRTRMRNETLFAPNPCRAKTVTPMTPVNNLGGCGGWTIGVSAEVDGYTA